MEISTMILALVAGVTGTAVLGVLAKGVDRKVTARLQWRVGPPLHQPALDCIKLLGKETVVPDTAQSTSFLVMPLFGLAGAGLAASMLWVMNLRPETGFVGDAIVVLYLLALPAVTAIIGAAATGNPYATVGAGREMKLLIGYELPLTIVILVSVIHTGGSLRIGEIVTAQQGGHAVALSLSGVLALVVMVMCVQAKLGLIPFDQAEAETELMAGIYTEYGGPPMAVITLSRFMLLAALPVLTITLFLGGIRLTGLGILWFAIKFVALLVVVTLIRNTNPRLRIDQSLRFFWYGMTPIALLALALAIAGRHYEVTWL
jgi:NADH-quinone oxidoreductase subunit H